ncbi:hypothetical protein [Nocardioides sp.]|uniref:hypothetical protein n=1 Tax=Nocardioides sp. TaxID=35761 RepID=UPI0035686983
MAERVVLHVGAMKSGTTYLQSLLFAQKPTLAASGVHVVGETWNDQVRGIRQALAPSRSKRPGPAWQRLIDEIAGVDGTAVISMEFLGPAGAKRAAQVVREVGASRTSVVVTARDLGRTLVSMWQETIQNGRSWTWEDYLADAERRRPVEGTQKGDRTSAGGTFWRQQDIVRIYSDWAEVVGPDEVTLVTVPGPGSGRGLLAERFAEASGLPIDAAAPVTVGNESLGLASALVLRRLNELLDEQGLSFPAGNKVRKKLLAKQVLAARRSSEPALGLQPPDWVREQAATTRRVLTDRQVRLVGDWADLTPVAVAGITPAEVDPAQVSEAAIAALAGVVADRLRPRATDES